MTLGFLLIILVGGFLLFFTSAGRRLLVMVIVLGLLATWGYNAVMSQVSAGVESAGNIPDRLLATLKNKFNEYFKEGRAIVDPVAKGGSLKIELYEYCLAEATFLEDNVKPSPCEAMSRGPERTACFETRVNTLRTIEGVSDLTQIDALRTNIRNQCNTRFNVDDAMVQLLGAGVRGVGQLYRYCEIPGACEESTFDNAPYRECLSQKFSTAPPQGLGLTESYCTVYSTAETREQWRKCVEVAMIKQTTKLLNLAQVVDPNVPGIRAIRACRQL